MSLTRTQSNLRDSLKGLWTRVPNASVGLAVRDPATRACYTQQATREFHAASTIKLAVLIEAHRCVEAGTLSLDDALQVQNRFASAVDGSPYAITDDSDEALYDRLGEAVPVRTLIRRMIGQSSNLATNVLMGHLPPRSIQNTVRELGAQGLRVKRGVEDLKAYREGINNTTTAAALATLLNRLREGTVVSPTADRSMLTLLRQAQPKAAIPSGLPDAVGVAQKTGWISDVHHDAAIIEPPGGPSYVLVVLTEGLTNRSRSEGLIARIAHVVHRQLRSEAGPDMGMS